MTILPVLDILERRVVHGVAGRRSEYRPIRSQLVDSTQPLPVAQALLKVTGGTDLYVADLDAILGGQANYEIYRELIQAGIQLWVDAGDCLWHESTEQPDDPALHLIAGLESLSSPELLQDLVARVGTERLTFSLDLQGGVPLANSHWSADARKILDRVLDLGIRNLIVLDLADVGTNSGGSTHKFCRELMDLDDELRIIVGGGIRGVADLEQWQDIGVWGVLVATALHDGRLQREHILQLQAP